MKSAMGSSGTPDPRKPKISLASGFLPPPRSTAKWTVESMGVSAAVSPSPSNSSFPCSPQSFILILEFVDKENMTQVLGRISAFSEGKVGKGKKSEAAAGETSKGYFGHNFPLTILEDFVQVHGGGREGGKERGCGDGLTDGERDLLGICRKQGLMGKGEGKGGGGGGGSKKGGGGRGRCIAASAYLIAYLKNDYATKQHELRHARFFLDEGYRSACLEAWAQLSEKQKKYVSSFLSRLGYHEDVHVDEFQAFHLTEKANFWGIKVDVAWPASVVEGE